MRTDTDDRAVSPSSGTIRRPKGPDLHWQGFEPACPPLPTLGFVHGLAEHFGRYRFPIEFFTEKGHACYGLDLRGHGLSEGPRAHVRRFDDYLADVDALVDLVRERRPDAPILLVGHSMGGLIGALYALDHGDLFSGLVLSSPGLQAHPDGAPSSLLLFFGRIASVLIPRLQFPTKLNPNFVSRSPKVVEAYRNDPLVTNKVTARWATEFLSAQDRCFRRASRLTIPTLVMQSGDDRLVYPEATRRWAGLIPKETSTYQEWPGFYHEMFNEPERGTGLPTDGRLDRRPATAC